MSNPSAGSSDDPTLDLNRDKSGAISSGGDAATVREGPGSTIGPYRLLELIGEGGFGSVFLAQQDKPVQRRVALKIIKLGMDTGQVVARFEQERQALAVMDHPNIAKVFDAGATDGGRPYFVMELCTGEPIDTYCNKNNLSIDDRLELFAQVCSAVQHAHTKGIIHRDIKPSNVLVSTQDGKPSAKVIDFGVAKATASKLTEKTLFTQHRQLIGTPEYMSPEQAEGSLDIDTRTDVYALGVMLYELLTGSTPFSGKELRQAAYAEIQRIIREVDPPRPSTRLSRNTDTIASVAAQRRTEPKKLGSIIRGELDWIVMKCLEKDRARRYETASGLALDILRYLSGDAVVAAPPSTIYQLRKFMRRHRVMVMAGSAVAAALLIGVIAFAWQAKIAIKQRDKAERIVNFMSDTLKGAGPSVAAGRDITMLKEMMDGAAARIEKGELKSAPEAELHLRQTIGFTYVELAQFPEAAKMFEPAVTLARSLHAGDDKTTVWTLDALARLRSERDELADAEQLRREALEMLQRVAPDDEENVALLQNNLAVLLQKRGDLAGAEPFYRAALATRKRLFKGDREDIATSLNSMSFLLRARGDRAGAEAFSRESLAMFKRLHPGDDPDVATGLNNLGILLLQRGDLEGAEPNLSESLAMMKRLHPGDHPSVASLLGSVAGVIFARGDAERAVPLYLESLEMKRRLFPGDHTTVATGLSNLGRALQRSGDLAGAEARLRESLDMYTRLFPGDNANVADALGNLGELLNDRGDATEAERLCRDALAMGKRLFKGDHPDMANCLNRLAAVLVSRNDFAGAEPLAREGVAMSESANSKDHWRTGLARLNFGRALVGMNNRAEAQSELVECERVLSTAKGVPPGKHEQCVEALAALYESWDRAEPGKGYDLKAEEWKAKLRASNAR